MWQHCKKNTWWGDIFLRSGVRFKTRPDQTDTSQLMLSIHIVSKVHIFVMLLSAAASICFHWSRQLKWIKLIQVTCAMAGILLWLNSVCNMSGVFVFCLLCLQKAAGNDERSEERRESSHESSLQEKISAVWGLWIFCETAKLIQALPNLLHNIFEWLWYTVHL